MAIRFMSLVSARFTSARAWINLHRFPVMFVSGLLGIAVVGSTAFAMYNQPMEKPDTTPIAIKPRPKIYYSPLTGLKVNSEADTKKPVTAIMIENSPDARPQSGLKDAEVVYEAVAEGGITRFLALYQQDKPQLIGPVRSVRPYYLDWVVPYDASIAHVGGSATALNEVRNGKYRDLDQFFNGGSYWRSSDRYAPHNVYTSFKYLDALNKAKGYKSSSPKSMDRTDGEPAKKTNATSISVTISSDLFNSSYSYDAKNNYYLRSQAGAQHMDREKGVITPKVVVVMNVNMHERFEDTTREVIQTTGSGQVTIFQNGTVIKGSWHKDTRASQLSFTDSNGKKVELVRGQTWITAIPNGKGAVSWQ